jgi:predicted amidophosphoribosyltransferase
MITIQKTANNGKTEINGKECVLCSKEVKTSGYICLDCMNKLTHDKTLLMTRNV